MLKDTSQHQQTSFFGADLLDQLDASDLLLMLSKAIPWSEFDREFELAYSDKKGRPKIKGPLKKRK